MMADSWPGRAGRPATRGWCWIHTKDLPQALADELVRRGTLGRFGTAEEVADAVAFLASDEAAFITGQVLAVDGGLVMMQVKRADPSKTPGVGDHDPCRSNRLCP